MAMVMMMAIVMVMKRTATVGKQLGQFSVWSLFSLVSADGDDETNMVVGEEGEMTTTGLLLEPFVSSYRR